MYFIFLKLGKKVKKIAHYFASMPSKNEITLFYMINMNS